MPASAPSCRSFSGEFLSTLPQQGWADLLKQQPRSQSLSLLPWNVVSPEHSGSAWLGVEAAKAESTPTSPSDDLTAEGPPWRELALGDSDSPSATPPPAKGDGDGDDDSDDGCPCDADGPGRNAGDAIDLALHLDVVARRGAALRSSSLPLSGRAGGGWNVECLDAWMAGDSDAAGGWEAAERADPAPFALPRFSAANLH